MLSYFKTKYDPSIEDMKKAFPDFEYTKKEVWMESFLNDYVLTPSKMAEFAYKKLDKVTTSYLLSDNQQVQLKELIDNDKIEKKVGWETYCNILTTKQIDYVGY